MATARHPTSLASFLRELERARREGKVRGATTPVRALISPLLAEALRRDIGKDPIRDKSRGSIRNPRSPSDPVVAEILRRIKSADSAEAGGDPERKLRNRRIRKVRQEELLEILSANAYLARHRTSGAATARKTLRRAVDQVEAVAQLARGDPYLENVRIKRVRIKRAAYSDSRRARRKSEGMGPFFRNRGRSIDLALQQTKASLQELINAIEQSVSHDSAPLNPRRAALRVRGALTLLRWLERRTGSAHYPEASTLLHLAKCVAVPGTEAADADTLTKNLFRTNGRLGRSKPVLKRLSVSNYSGSFLTPPPSSF